METLFPLQSTFRVVRLSEADAARSTDALRLLGDQLSASEDAYPGIQRWFRGKVVPGLRDGSRVAYLGFEGEAPVLTAVVKRGERAKFCHLRVAEDFQDLHLGELFFSIMALEVRNTAKEIHFTLPEGLWARRREFFAGFGFRDVTRSRLQYRLFEEELRTSAPFWDVWRSVRQRLPRLSSAFSMSGLSMSPSLLLSVRPEFADRLLSGEKSIEVRRRFHARWRGSRVALYSTSPERALVGEATIGEVEAVPPVDLWDRYGPQLGCTRQELLTYAGDRDEVFAIRLDEMTPYAAKMPICQFEHLLERSLVPPQSHCSVDREDSWGQALSIAALLHSCRRSSEPVQAATVL